MIPRRMLPAALTALTLPAPAPAQAQTPSTLDRIKSTKTMRIGVVGGQPPYSWKDLATGQWTGFMPDIATDLATTLGATIEPVESTWGNAALDIQAGKVDIFFCLAPTPQRALVADFTTPLFQNAFALIARHGFEPKTWEDLDRPEIRIALELGSVYDQNVEKLAPRATLIRLKTNNEAVLNVQAGRADCQMIVVILALVALARNQTLGHLVVPQPLFGSPTAAMLPKDQGTNAAAWRETVDTWLTRRRTEGWVRKTLVDNLAKVGVRSDDVPPQLLF